MPSRRHFLAGSAAALGAAAFAPDQASASFARRPNFVVVLADDLGYGEVGVYGQRLMQTPNLDRLAAEGLRFTDAYANGPVCAPARCALLTGLHSGHARVRQNPGNPASTSLHAEDTTFAELLRARGYRTACIGKWGFGPEEAGQPSHPNARGFDEFFGYMTHGHAHDYYPAYLWHNGAKETLPDNADGQTGTFAPDLFADHAVRFITDHAREPFLLYLAPNVPHAPSDIPDLGRYADRDWPAADRGHAAQVTYVDTLVGKVVDVLRRRGVAQRTIVIVTSDNGPHEERGVDPDRFDANGPLRGYKRNVYEGGVRVPMIAWSPGRIAPGVSRRPTPHIDLLPTLADLAGAPIPTDVDGLSVAPLLTGRSGGSAGIARHDYLYWYRLDGGVTARANAVDGGRIRQLAEAVRHDDWKAVRFAPGRDRSVPDDQWQVELYDLGTDQGETTDLAAVYPDVTARLVGFMRDAWVEPYQRAPFGLRLAAPEPLRPGSSLITVALDNGTASPWSSVRLTLTAPNGWLLRPTSPHTAARLAPGRRLATTWQLSIPPGTQATQWRLRATATAVGKGGPLRFTDERRGTPVF